MLVLRHARLAEQAEPCDLVVHDGVVRAVAAAGATAAARAARLVDLEGALVLPGLHDHHVHLRSWVASLDSVAVGPPEVTDADGLALALRRPGKGWLRAVGYHESVAGHLDRRRLDQLAPHRPVRVQHRSGAVWVLNSLALEALEPQLPATSAVERDDSGEPTGRLFRLDGWLAGLTRRRLEAAELSGLAASRGVTGFTEAGPDPGPDMLDWLSTEKQSGRLGQRLLVMAPSRAGTEPPTGSRWGPVKFLLDDVDLPALDDLSARFGAAHARGLPAAVHSVTRQQLWLALCALEEAGPRPGDRIEHGSVIPEEAIARIASAGVAVVTNPGLVRHRGDQYQEEVDPDDRPHLYRAASLRAAGVTLAAGTDAPFGPTDPWEAVRAASDRRTLSGLSVGDSERLGLEDAVGLFLADPEELGRTRRVVAGVPADLCVLAAGRLSEAVARPDPVAITVQGGEIVHGP